MRFSSFVTALSLASTAQCYVVSAATAVNKTGCVTAEHIEIMRDGLLHLSQEYKFPFPEGFPHPSDLRGKDPNECVPESASDAVTDALVRASKVFDFESKYAEYMGHPTTQLAKRARTCQDIEQSAEQRTASTWSCRSAPHFNACKSCTALSTVGYISYIGVCLSKQLTETVPCCILGTTIYIAAYSNVCLSK
ncbi:hypothetical protein ACJQWK_02471 [Exserohilum turcicum]|uniref:Uncharacterized protein n=1 Tax=Exserohilum turcicum (strain 28A) TaxID=671987 RepID=R0KA04_EXST2|nr:uncharacterized protein SETTUDRAFT_103943 [Exserohilum turcica Et28A]EOA89813.1 hypothetical protein SETTUDRAFT_103943 [Exserohilum turcica Et28A]